MMGNDCKRLQSLSYYILQDTDKEAFKLFTFAVYTQD
mgnify:CR=1 FL=1